MKRFFNSNPAFALSVLIVLLYAGLAVFAQLGWISSDQGVTNHKQAYLAPDFKHWLGTDLFGRDVLIRAVMAIKTSMTVGWVGSALAMIIGTMLGACAGYFRGWVDVLVVWLYSTMTTIPSILLIIALAMVLGPGLMTMCVAIGCTGWIQHARIIRAEVMRQREMDYVQSAVALGLGRLRILTLHILPNVFHLVLINFSLGFISAVKSEVILSYLGLGVDAGVASWGVMIADAKLELARDVWWGLAAATGFMFILVMAFTLANEGLRQYLDPQRDA